MFGQKRVDQFGDVTRVVHVTIPESVYSAMTELAVREGVPITRVLRAAVTVGVARVASEYEKERKGEANKVEKIREIYRQDKRLKHNREERKKSKRIVRNVTGKWHYADGTEEE